MSSATKSNDAVTQTEAPMPAKIPWSPVVAVVFVVVIYFVSQLVGGLLLSIYPMVRHWSDGQANTWINNSVLAQFGYVVIAEGLMLLPLWWFLKRYKFGFGKLGLTRIKADDMLYALGGFMMYFFSYAILLSIATKAIPSLNVNQPQQIGFQTASGFGPLALTAISLVILPPIVEEILVRGFLYTSLKKSLPKIVAALITSIIFASAHLEFGSGAPLLWVAAIDTFTLSLVLCYLREKTGRLWASMGVHGLKNAIAFASLFIFHVR
ncbi:MAG TPA: CPBP family intramembrane glutamic endopeptidase [Candidatus Saccharimonadales bacterium]|jgi:membrane protease YdiL (CAAX protease family)